MTKKTIALDVDGVLNNIGKHWYIYLCGHYQLKKEYRNIHNNDLHNLPYNLTEMFEVGETLADNGFEFWNNYFLYENVLPRGDAVEYIPAIAEKFDLIFCTKVIGNHYNSKIEWINKWFPYHKGIIVADTKQHTKCDILVDDNIANLNSMPDNVQCIRFRADYYQEQEPIKRFRIVWGFEDLFNYLNENM